MEYDLVFEGGGAKGLAFVGALTAFERRGHTTRRVIGTSAGSILAALLASGYTASEALAAISERLPDGRPRFASFLQIPTIADNPLLTGDMRNWLNTQLDNPDVPDLIEPLVDRVIDSVVKRDTTRHLVSLLLWGGWYADDEFLRWLREKLDSNGRACSAATLQQLNERTGVDLSVVASDVSGQEMLVLNHRTAPALPAAWAVRMSMGCPFAWPEVIWRPEWGTYRGRDLAGHRVVDGGLLSNFPIKLLVSSDEHIDEIMGKDAASENVIGFLIDESLPVPGAGEPPQDASAFPALLDRLDVVQGMIWRIRGLADTVLTARDKFMNEKDQRLVCRLPAQGYGSLEFDMSTERMQAIRSAGEAAAERYLEGL
jgi:predicted acylesterase/phospholipase RssA